MKPANPLLTKLQNYCAYQERSQYEVRQKLFDEKVYGEKAEQLISRLIEENFLNEERFAVAYAGGKFRIKQWGKVKIKMGLKQKQVPDKLIAKALASLPYDDYLETLKGVLAKKEAQIGEKDGRKKTRALLTYAIGRGFEADLVLAALKAGDD